MQIYPTFLDTDQCASYALEAHGLPFTPRWYRDRRTDGGGPRFILAGKKPRYALIAIDAWVKELTAESHRSNASIAAESVHRAIAAKRLTEDAKAHPERVLGR